MLSVISHSHCPNEKLTLDKIQSLDHALFGQLDLAKPYPYAEFIYGKPRNSSQNQLLCVSPLSLVAGMRELAIQAMPEELSVSDEEGNAIVELLKPIFNESYIDIFCHDSTIFIETQKNIQTVPYFELRNISLKQAMPVGNEDNFWARLFVECQMLLTNAAFNIQRQNLQKPPINALWFWGEGELLFSQQKVTLVTDYEFLPHYLKNASQIDFLSVDEFLSLKNTKLSNKIVLYLKTSSRHIEKKINQLNKKNLLHRVWLDGQKTFCQNGFLSKLTNIIRRKHDKAYHPQRD